MATWIKYQYFLSPVQFPVASLIYHPAFREAVSTGDFRQWEQAGGIIKEDQLIQKMGNFPGLGNQFIQIKHVLHFLNRTTNIFQALTHFEKLLESGTLKEALDKIYLILVAQEQVPNRSRKAWEKHLGREVTEEQRRGVSLLVQKLSSNVALKEYCYKLQHRWYRTPWIVAKMFPGTSASCWRCGEVRATY